MINMISRYHFYLSFVTSAILFELQNLHFALKFIQSLTFLQGETDFLYWLAEWLGATNHTLCLARAFCTVTSTSIIFSLVKIVLLFFRWDWGVWSISVAKPPHLGPSVFLVHSARILDILSHILSFYTQIVHRICYCFHQKKTQHSRRSLRSRNSFKYVPCIWHFCFFFFLYIFSLFIF